jgi:hypothetical protein
VFLRRDLRLRADYFANPSFERTCAKSRAGRSIQTLGVILGTSSSSSFMKSSSTQNGIEPQFPPSIFGLCNATFMSEYECMLEAKLAAEGIAIGDINTNANNPVGVANLAANAVLAYRHADNSNQAGLYADTTGYAPLNSPCRSPFRRRSTQLPSLGVGKP